MGGCTDEVREARVKLRFRRSREEATATALGGRIFEAEGAPESVVAGEGEESA